MRDFVQEKLTQLLMAEQWEAALLLAETHNLDEDLVRRYPNPPSSQGMNNPLLAPRHPTSWI